MSSGSFLPAELANTELPSDPLLTCGRLPNGLRYFLRHNAYPHNAVSAFLEVNVGSLNEKSAEELTEAEIAAGESDEQGIAHVLEHCVFLGTDAFPTGEDLRTVLSGLGMSWGGDSNAYTDYRSTVYTLESPYRVVSDEDELGMDNHAPKSTEEGGVAAVDSGVNVEGGPPHSLSDTNIPTLLHILHQLAFKATFPEHTVEREKVAVLSEAAMRNTTEYRVEVAMTAQAQRENKLPHRLPIGLTSVVRNVTVQQLQKFYNKWYKPQFMTLYLVGPFETMRYADIIAEIQRIFAAETNGNSNKMNNSSSNSTPDTSSLEFGPSPTFLRRMEPFPNPNPVLQQNFGGPSPLLSSPLLSSPALSSPALSRPPLSSPLIALALSPLISKFSLSLQRKKEPRGYDVTTYGEYAKAVADMLVNSIFDNRMSALRNKFSTPPFSSIDIEDSVYSDQQCAMQGLHVSADIRAEDGTVSPRASRWFQAITIAFREALRLHRHGVMHNELQLAAMAMLKEFRDSAQAEDSTTTVDVLSNMQQCLYDTTAFTSRKQDLQIFEQILPSITTETVSSRARELTQFVSDFCAACARKMPEIEEGSVDPESIFAELTTNTVLFVCSPGPTDTISRILPASVAAAAAPTDTPAAISGIVARVGAPDDFDLGASALPSAGNQSGAAHSTFSSPTLIDRLRQVSSRRAKIVRMVSQSNEEEEEGDDAEGSEESGSDAAGEPEPHTHLPGSSLLPYEIQAIDVLRAVLAALDDTAPPEDIDLPEHLLDEKLLHARQNDAAAQHAHAGVAYGLQVWESTGAPELHDAETDATMIRCSNGITVCYKRTTFEPNLIDISIIARGGKDVEGPNAWRGGLVSNSLTADPASVSTLYPTYSYGPIAAARGSWPPIPCGAVSLGLKTMFNSGAGKHSVDAILRYCMLWGLHVNSSVGTGSLQFVLSATSGPLPDHQDAMTTPSPLAKLLEMFHVYVADCHWETVAFERSRDEELSDLEGIPLSLERACNAAVTRTTFGGDDRFVLPSPQQAAKISLVDAKRSVIEQLAPPNLQVNIIGDINPAEVPALVLRYLACLQMPSDIPRIVLPPTPYPVAPFPMVRPPSPSSEDWTPLGSNGCATGTFVHVSEEAERCCLAIAVPQLPRYISNEPLDGRIPVIWPNGRVNRDHPLFLYRCANVWQDVLNNRLYRRLRDATGACYSVSFSSTPLDFYDGGAGMVVATPIPSMCTFALVEAVRLINNLFQGTEPLSISEMEEAKIPIVQSLRTQLRTNAPWHTILSFVSTHRCRKTWASIHSVMQFYQCVVLEDVQEALAMTQRLQPSPLAMHVVCGYTGNFRDIVNAGDNAAKLEVDNPQVLFRQWLSKCSSMLAE